MHFKRTKAAINKTSPLTEVFILTQPTVEVDYLSSITCKIHSSYFSSSSSSSTSPLTSLAPTNIIHRYLTMQLENSVHSPMLGASNRFAQLSPDEVYHAVLAMKIIDNWNGTGEFFDYVECRTYHVLFIGQFLVTLAVFAVLGGISKCFFETG